VYGVVALAVLQLALKLDLGPEYDTNANRAEVVQGMANVDQPTASPLVRTTTKMSLSWQSGISLLRLSGGLGAKVFFNPDVQDQDTLVGELGLDERLSLGRFVDLGVAGDYHDAGQLDVAPPCADMGCNRRRDFRTGSANLRLSFIEGPGDLTLSGGWRAFQYKPDESYDFEAAQASAVAAARTHVGQGEHLHEIGFAASYHLERRWFSGVRWQNNICGPGEPITAACIQPDAMGTKREDWFHEADFELSYLGPVYATLGYGLQLNRSNSFGYSLLRHILTVRLAGRLPGQLYATLKAQLLLASYFDPQILGETTNQTCLCLEDENRSAVIVDLERPIGKSGLAVEARYSFYTNEIADTQAQFMRHVIYVGVSYKVGWRLGKKPPPEP
jgi:hypothetical protein